MNNKNIENNEQKDTYDKLITGSGVDLFSEDGFDEMQKMKNHEIGFNLFRIFYWVMYVASMAVMLTAFGLENTVFTIIGCGLTVLCTLFYFLYAAKTSAAGVMNRRFAESMSKKSTLFFGIGVLVLWLLMITVKGTDLVSAGCWLIMAVMYIGNYLCARRNMKAVEKMLKENDEEE